MKSFKTVFLYELNKYFKAKGYLILTIVLMLGVAITVFFPRIKSSIFQKEASETKKKTVWVSLPEDIQDTENTQKQDLYLLSFTKMFPAASVEIVETTEENIWKAIEDESVTCAFVLTDLQSYTYYTNNIGLYDSNTEAADEAIREAYTAASLQDAGISADQIRTILDVNVSHEIRSLGKDQRENFMYTYVMIMTLYMVIVFYGQGVATGVASEKDSRAMELLVTSVKPTPMIFGKILSASVAGMVQIICVFGTAILSFRFNGAYWERNSVIRSLFNVPAYLLGYMLLFFVLV